MFVFTVLFSKYFEVHAELCGTRKFMFSKVGRDLKSLGTTALWYTILMADKKCLLSRLKDDDQTRANCGKGILMLVQQP